MHQWRLHETARVIAGKHAGTAGKVIEVKGEGGAQRVRVRIEGVSQGEPIDVTRWFAAREVEQAP